MPDGGSAVDDRIVRLECTVGELQQALLSLQQRVDTLESRRHVVAAATQGPLGVRAQGEGAAGPASGAGKKAASDPIVILSLIGRLFLVLAGGFFLRAMTDSGVLVPSLGLSIGFVYAMVWLVFADRAGGRGQTQNSFFHALATAMIAFPLLVEAATKFKVLPAIPSAAAVALLAAALLFVAWHRRLRFVAWIAVIGTLPTGVVLLAQTGEVAPFALLFIVFGVATLWFSYTLDWWGIRWPAALAADLAVVGVTMRVLAPVQPDPPQVAMLLQLTLLGAYVASIAIRTLVRGRNVVPFEVAQTIAALVIGFGGALYLTQVTGILPQTIGLVSLLLGAAGYGVAIAFLDRHKDKGRNVYYYTSLGLVHVVAGLTLVLREPWLGVVLAVLAVLAAALWSRFGRSFMLVHSAAYLLVASIASGALIYCVRTLTIPSGPWVLPEVAMAAVMFAGAASVWLASARRNPTGDEIAAGLRLVIILVFLSAAAACVIGWMAPLAAGRPDRTLDSGAFATLGTGVLAVATLLIAWLGSKSRFREWAWLVYPLLVGIGVKMAAEDFKHSRPSTLFIAMALYGAALIIAPRLRRGESKASAEAAA
jgi:hypothetical protein